MRNLIITALLFLFGFSQAQTLIFNENFDATPLKVTSSGSSNWSLSSTLKYSGSYSDTARITGTNDTTILTTDVFNASSYNHVLLQFKHIAKLSLFDGGYIEVSADNGATWTRLSHTQYYGQGYFGQSSNPQFNSTSYAADWDYMNANATPQNSWWKKETFDLSYLISGVSQAKIRFVLHGSSTNYYGWLLDDIEVTGSNNELIPPTVSLNTPYPQDTAYGTGPYDISATITDSSGVSGAILVYSANGVSDTLTMVHKGGNIYEASIPSYSYGTNFCYKIYATDNNSNVEEYPTLSCISFVSAKSPNAPPAFPYDVAVYSIDDPQNIVLANVSSPVNVKIVNRGDSVLTKAKIGWELDGNSKTTHNWTGSLTNDMVSTAFTLGNETYAYGSHDITVYAFDPNDSTDQNTANDTIHMSFFACNEILHGTYTLGGAGADFADFADLLDALNHCGLNAPTTIQVNPGVYNESFTLSGDINGLDSINTLTIVSSTNNKQDVIITNANLSGAESVIEMDSVAWVTLKDISLKGNGSQNQKTLDILENSHNIKIENCQIEADYAYNTSLSAVSVYGAGIKNIELINNTIKGGYYAIRAQGSYQSKQSNIKIVNNTVNDYYHYGIYVRYSNFPVISGNEVNRAFDNLNTSTLIGISITFATSVSVEQNKVILEPAGSAQGIYIYSGSGTSANPASVVNNMVSLLGSSNTTAYGIYVSTTSNIHVFYNSVGLYSGSTTSSYAYYTSGSTATNMYVNNNVFAHFNGGFALAHMSGTFSSLDYNTYYTNGLNSVKWGYSSYAPTSGGITAIRTLTSADTNSIFANPNYYSPRNLHSYGSSINGAAKPIASVTEDIDGQLRDATTPDIGADEFSISSVDVGVLDIISPLATDTQNNNVPFKVVVANFGSAAVTAFTIKSSINGTNPPNYSWTGNLASGQSDTVLISNFTVPAGEYNVTAYTVLSGDTLNYNDTIKYTREGLPLVELEITELVNPNSGCGKTSNEEISVRIKNNGVGTISNGITVSYRVNSNTMVSESVPVSLGPDTSIVYTFNQKADLASYFQDTTYSLTLAVHHSADAYPINDTTITSVTALANLLPPVVSDTTINYGDSVQLTASSPYPIYWYDNDSTNNVIGQNTMYTPILFDTTTYYAQANMYNPPANAQIGFASTTLGPFDPSPYGANMGSGRYQMLFTAAELQAAGITAGYLESIAFKGSSTINGPSSSFEISLANVPNTSLTNSFISTTLTTVYTYNGSFTGSPGWNVHTFSTPFYWDGNSSLLINICTVGNPYNASPIYYTSTSSTMVVSAGGMGAGCTSTTGLTSNKRPNIKIVKQGTNGCYSAKVPLTVNVPLPAIDARVSEIVNPKDGCGLASSQVSIEIENMGTDTIKGPFTATYKLNNGNYISAETINDTIPSGSSIIYNFNTLASMPSGANGTKYVITAKVNVSGDAYSPNDVLASDSILSKYTPANPIVSNMTINYGDSATLTAVANDTVYWYADSLGTNLVGSGSSFTTDPIYDTTSFYAQAQKTVASAYYNIGTGTSIGGYSDPSPYGGGGYSGYGQRTQFLITATELKAMGLIQGPIESVSFNVANMVGIPLNNYTIKLGHTTYDNMTVSCFQDSLTTVYSVSSYSDHGGWNEHVFSTPFIWDGHSNLIIQTCFKNNSGVNYARVYYTQTPVSSVGYNKGTTGFNCADSTINYNSDKRPNIKIKQTGLGACPSDLIQMDVNVINYVNHDAALTAIVDPDGPVSSTTQVNVKVVLHNYGLNSMTAATINWAENGTAQTAYSWTGNLAKGGVDTVTIATNHLFKGGITNIKAWVSLANDTMYKNDTTEKTVYVCMSGAYTINPTSGDFSSFTEAVNNLETVGICGPVVINADSAIYSERVVLHAINGSSATNTITFQSTAHDSTKVQIAASTLSNSNYIIMIDGASYINIKHLQLRANGSNYGNVIVLSNHAHHINIENNYLVSSVSTSYSAKASNIYTFKEGVDNVTIKNNAMQNGYKSIDIEGISTDSVNHYVISGNNIYDFTYSGIRTYYANDVEIVNNTITSSNSGTNTSAYGIYIYKGIDGFTISKNKMDLKASSTVYGIYLSNTLGSSSNRLSIDNNFVAITAGSSVRAIYIYGIKYADVVYNSVNVLAGNASTSALYANSGDHLNVLNNSLSTKNGYALFSSSIPASSLFDYNNYHVDSLTSSSFVYWTSSISDLAALKVFDTSNNQHSISIDPLYFNMTDLHSQQISMYNTGTPLTAFPTDIDGDTRSTTAPSIGADEFAPPAIDLGVTALIHPQGSDCGYSANDSIIVQIKNYGLNNINFATQNTTVKVLISGVVNDTIYYTLNSGTLNSSDLLNVTVSNNYDLSTSGLYKFIVAVSIANDGNANNDVLSLQNVISYPNINSFPYSENFESGVDETFAHSSGKESSVSASSVAGYNSSFGLYFDGGSYKSWTGGSTVTSAFANTEHVSKATTCNIDATNNSSLYLQFDLRQTKYSTYNNSTSWFRVLLIDANNNEHYLKNIAGDSVFKPTTKGSDPYVRQTFDMSAYAGQNFKVSLQAANKYSYTGYGDRAYVDNVKIWEPANVDIGVDAIAVDYLHGEKNDSMIVKAVFTNMGTDTLYSISMAYQVGNGTIVYDTINGTYLPTQSDTMSFTKPYVFTLGMHKLCVFGNLAADTIAVNDTACVMIKGMDVFSPDYSDDFETKTDWFAEGMIKQWKQGTPNKTNMNGAHSGQKAWVTNLNSDYVAGSDEYLYTPYFVIPPYAKEATVSFYMFMDVIGSNAYGNLEYSFDGVNWLHYGYIGMPGSVNWYNINKNGVHSWAMQNSGWQLTSAKLDSTVFNTGQTFQLRFSFHADGNPTTAEGWAIDDFAITIPAMANDAGVVKIQTPNDSTAAGDSIMVKVKIKNFGTDTLTSIPVEYTIDGVVTGSGTWTGTLYHNQTDTFSIPVKYSAPVQNYKLCAYTKLNNDMLLQNDTTCAMINSTKAKIDAGISTILAPYGQTSIGKPTEVKVRIVNYGSDTLENIPVEYFLNGSFVASEVSAPKLAPGDSTDYLFTTKYTSGAGTYSICARTQVIGDKNTVNDKACVTVVGTSIGDAGEDLFSVSQNQPNPAKGKTKIEFYLPKSGQVEFKLVNMIGAEVEHITQSYTSGKNQIEIDTDQYPAGVYHYSVSFEGETRSFKMVIIR